MMDFRIAHATAAFWRFVMSRARWVLSALVLLSAIFGLVRSHTQNSLACSSESKRGIAEESWACTFSIAAFDPDRNEWGVAVASKYLAVGSVVPWAKAGVGAVAT